MGEIYELLVSFLNSFLSEPWGQRLLDGALALSVLILAYLAVRRFLFRNNLYISNLSQPVRLENGKVITRAQLTNEVIREIRNILAAHPTKSGLDRGGEVTQLRLPQRLSENVGVNFEKIIEVALEINPLAKLTQKVVYWLWPPLVAKIEMHRDNDTIYCHGTLIRGKPLMTPIYVRKSVDETDLLTSLAEELVYRVVIDSVRRRRSRGLAYVGTENWKALKAHTEALREWQEPAFDLNVPQSIARVQKLLEESIEHDPNYAMAHYNLAVLIHSQFRNAEFNELARSNFQKAAVLAQNAGLGNPQAKTSGSQRVEGLAKVGISRCYSQDRHRFGNMDQKVVEEAREAAEEAMRLLKGDADALYALAFAWHCTEVLEDIKAGRALYEKIIRKEPKKYPTVHNNLGYILMTGGHLLEKEGKIKEAEEWYEAAQQQMNIVIETTGRDVPSLRFSYANRGNLNRLRHQYERAIQDYVLALDHDPENSKYTNGLNELACVYFDRNKNDDMVQAIKYHTLALNTTSDRNHHLRLMNGIVAGLRENNHPQLVAIEAALAVQKARPELDLEGWVESLWVLLLPENARVGSNQKAT